MKNLDSYEEPPLGTELFLRIVIAIAVAAVVAFGFFMVCALCAI